MATISLTRGYVAVVDDADVDVLSRWSWQVMINPRTPTPYAVRRGGEGEPKTVYMHRMLMGAQSGETVDHISGDGLDNRRANLRLCSQSMNARNRRKLTPGGSHFKGVTHRRETGKWRARIRIDGTLRLLGEYADERAAAHAYDAAARQHFGDFARLNFTPTH